MVRSSRACRKGVSPATTCLALQHQPPKPGARALLPSRQAPNFFAFGPFVLIPDRQLLLDHGSPVRLGKRSRDLLSALVQRPGDVVSKRELIAHAWPDVVVEDENLKVNIAALRRVLRDESDPPLYVATVVGRGYSFVAPVWSSDSVLRDLEPSPVPVPLPKRAHNVPTGPTRIFGREAVIASIVQDLARSRLVSIVGPGGIGKTTVALAVAREAADVFEDGILLVDLTDVNDDSLVSDAVAAVLATSAPPRHGHAALGDLRDRKLLLVLDNCEHVIDGVARCADQVLTTARNVKLLATSREPLCIKEERVRRLAGLGTPPALGKLQAAEALEFAAIQLFVDRATNASEAFALSETNAGIIAEICRRLDGLALAIERIALRIETLGVGNMLDYIANRSHLLDEHPVGPARHYSMNATIDWSYNLLSQNEQAVMRRLSTFTGAFSLESACTVGAGDDLDPVSVVEVVASLAAKSLLATEARDGGMDYRQTHLARAFGLGKLLAHGELESVQRRHAEHCRRLAEQAGAVARAPGRPAFCNQQATR